MKKNCGNWRSKDILRRPEAFPLGGRWLGEAVTDEGTSLMTKTLPVIYHRERFYYFIKSSMASLGMTPTALLASLPSFITTRVGMLMIPN